MGRIISCKLNRYLTFVALNLVVAGACSFAVAANAQAAAPASDEAAPAAVDYRIFTTAVNNCVNTVKTQLEICDTQFKTSISQVDVLTAQRNQAIGKKMSINIVGKTMEAESKLKQSEAVLMGAQDLCTKAVEAGELCEKVCGPKVISDIPATSRADEAVRPTASAKVLEEANSCRSKYASYIAQFTEGLAGAKSGAAGAAYTKMELLAGAAVVTAVGVGAGLMIKSSKDKKEDKKDKKEKEEYANGVIKGPDGKKVNCLTEGTFGAPECQEVLFSYCAKTENSGKAGCSAFNNTYCSKPDASQSYCMANAAKNYCAQGGATTQSPTCMWVASRPLSCQTKPEDVTCMAKYSPAQLDTMCPNFPNDPLCQSHNAGNVVVQPVGGPIAGRTQTDGMSALVGSGDQSSEESLWSQNSAAYAELCQSGQISNCN